MNGKSFVDTNVLVYAHDRSAGIKHERARSLVERLWQSGEGVLSTQVLQELSSTLQRKIAAPLSIPEIRDLLEDYLAWEIVVNDSNSAIEALDLQSKFKISFWDALILHAAENSGAEVLYSEDFNANQRYGALQIVNPFAN